MRILWTRRHAHTMRPWPGRDGWEFCTGCGFYVAPGVTRAEVTP